MGHLRHHGCKDASLGTFLVQRGIGVNAKARRVNMAVGKNQWYHVGVGALGAPPILVYFSGDWDVHGVLTHGHMGATPRLK